MGNSSKKSKQSREKSDRLLAWLGNNCTNKKVISRFIPEGVPLIVSPFFGAGGVELYLLRARQDLHIEASDVCAPLVTFWKQMMASCDTVVAKIDRLLPKARTVSESEFQQWHKVVEANSKDVLEPDQGLLAAKFWLVNHLVFNGLMPSGCFHSPNAEKLRKTRAQCLQRLHDFEGLSRRRFSVSLKDCFEVIEGTPADALLFLDPPYIAADGLRPPVRKLHLPRGGMSSFHYLGCSNWDVEAHTRLYNVLSTRSRWILCHQDDPIIRELYRDFRIVEYSVSSTFSPSPYTATEGNEDKKKSRLRRGRCEMLILSPWVSEELYAQQCRHSLQVCAQEKRDQSYHHAGGNAVGAPILKRQRLHGKQHLGAATTTGATRPNVAGIQKKPAAAPRQVGGRAVGGRAQRGVELEECIVMFRCGKTEDEVRKYLQSTLLSKGRRSQNFKLAKELWQKDD